MADTIGTSDLVTPRPEVRGVDGVRHRQPMAFAQFAARYSLAFVVCASVRNTGVPSVFGRAPYAVLSIVPAFAIASARTGRAPPLSHRFWPSSE